MKKSCLMLLALIIFAACNTNKNNAEAAPDSVSDNEMSIQIGNKNCYEAIVNNDTVYLKLEKFPNVVTGTLKYKLHEKDANEGELDGKFFGDTLIADYKFKSEGTESVRQVAFLIKEKTATEGYADMEEKNGRMIFKNTAKLDFSNGMQLNKIDCPVE